MTQLLKLGRLTLALHTLRAAAPDDTAGALLLLHGLGECSPVGLPAEYSQWRGAVRALDFTGHGQSAIPVGGGYTCEALMLDVITALNALGPCTLVGRGLGAYAALMAMAARADLVRAAVLRDGPGLSGGGDGSQCPTLPVVCEASRTTPDAQALADLATDVRQPDAAARWARLIREGSPTSAQVHFCLQERPAWVLVVADALSRDFTSLSSALRDCAGSSVKSEAHFD